MINMSWENILKADNVGYYGENESVAWYDPRNKETYLNLSRLVGLDDLVDADLHETIHQFTYDDIKEKLLEVVDEETKFLINRPDLYRVEGGKVQAKRQLFNEVLEKRKIASHIAFTEIVTLIQSRTKVNYESISSDKDGFKDENEVSQYYDDIHALNQYHKQFAGEMSGAYGPMWINIMKGALNALGLDPNTNRRIWYDLVTERGVKRMRKMRDEFFKSVGSIATNILMEIVTANEPIFSATIDYVKKPESYTDAKERMKRFEEESPEDRAKRIKDKVAGRKMKKSWEGVLKNIQISGQNTLTRDYVLPEDDKDCCELLKKIVKEATTFNNKNFGEGMVGVPTFSDTSGDLPNDDFLDKLSDWAYDDDDDKRDFVSHVVSELSKYPNVERGWEKMQELWIDSEKYALSHRDSCEEIVDILDKWSDKNFAGWEFYKEWVHTVTNNYESMINPKQIVDRDYERYMDSYRKIWIALLQNNCADILIQQSWMNYGGEKK